MRIIIFLILCLYVMPNAAVASGNSDATSANASARVIRPLVAKQIEVLRFGHVQAGEEGGSITIFANNNQRVFTGTTAQSLGSKPYGRAVFEISGDAGRGYTVELPDALSIYRAETGGSAVNITDFHAYSKNLGTTEKGKLGTDGKDTLYIGGKLHLPTGSLAGYYMADFEVTVSYQ